MLEKASSREGLSRIGTGCLGKQFGSLSLKSIRRYVDEAIRFSDGLGSEGLMVGLRSLFQPKLIYAFTTKKIMKETTFIF